MNCPQQGSNQRPTRQLQVHALTKEIFTPFIAACTKPLQGSPSPSACVHLYSNSDLALLIAYALMTYCMTHGLHKDAV
jgi:hypothetical protein